jgi:hypothetical protein
MKKTFLSFLAALAIFASFMPISHADPIQNADGSYSGNCFDFSENILNVTWNFNETTRNLIISGTGTAIIDDELCDINYIYTSKSEYIPHCVDTIIFEDGITTVSGFNQCRNASSITFPDSLTSIGNDCDVNFINNEKLSTLTIPINVTSILNSSFESCPNLETIYLPKGIKTISSEAFYLTPIKDVYYAGTQAEWDAVSGNFPSAIKNAAIHCNDTTLPPAPQHDFYTASTTSTIFHVPVHQLNYGKYYINYIYIHIYSSDGKIKGHGSIILHDKTEGKVDVEVKAPLNVGDRIHVSQHFLPDFYKN